MDERTHSTSFDKPEYSNLVATIRGAQEDVMDAGPAAVDAPPSIYHLIQGKTFLRDQIDLPKDSSHSEIINDFILEKMKSQGFKNSKEGYQQVLKGILREIGLTDKHNGELIVNSIYDRFMNKTINAADYLLFLNILANRGR